MSASRIEPTDEEKLAQPKTIVNVAVVKENDTGCRPGGGSSDEYKAPNCGDETALYCAHCPLEG
jgi:hypothetical protein